MSEHNIDFNCFYDTDLSCMDFQDNFKNLGNHLLLYTGYQDLKVDEDDIFQVNNVEKLCELYDSFCDYREEAMNTLPEDKLYDIIAKEDINFINQKCLEEEFEYYDFDDIGEFIETIKSERWDASVYIDLLSDKCIAGCVEASKPYMYIPSLENIANNLKYFSDIEDMGLKCKKDWKIVYSNGYSQGDYCYVICKSNEDEKHIEHLLWDCPIAYNCEIDDKDIYIGDKVKDIYKYDKNEVLEIIKNEIGEQLYDKIEDELIDEIEDELIDEIPDEPTWY